MMRNPQDKKPQLRPASGRAAIALAGILILAALCLPSSPVNFIGGSAKAQTDNQMSPAGMQQIAALLAEKASRTPAQQKIDSRLLQATREFRGQAMTSGVQLERANVNADATGMLNVDIDANVSDDLINSIEQLGGQIIYPSFEYKTIRARVSLTSVETIAGFSAVKFIKPAVRSMTSRISSPSSVPGTGLRPGFAERAARVRSQLLAALRKSAVEPFFTGSVDSQGDRTHRADDTRNTFGYFGAGVRVGVLSDSLNSMGGLAADVASGDLPGVGNPLGNTTPVTIVQDLGPGGTDEGRAMMQIVHDLAPKAQLFFATADLGEASFAANIQALRNAPNNCDIIIDDVFYFDESPFQDGIIAQAVNTVTAAGALYFSAGGNEGSLAKGTAGYFEGDFNDTGSQAFTFPAGAKTGTIHNFGTPASPINGDIITATGEAYTMDWTDPLGKSTNDYDLFLVDSTGTVKAQSTNIQNGSQNPHEEIDGVPALVTGDRLVVFKTSSAAVRAFSINTLRGTMSTAVTKGQTHGHSAAVNAFSVAATPAVGPFPSAFSSANNVESFSSDGPRRVFFNADGTAITPGNFLFGTSGGTVRNKPDITAADGVNTSGNSLGPGLNPFFGTSAAAPHAGAIAALLKSANPSLTAAQIRTILTTTTADIEGAGYDINSGFGIVQAFQAMQAVNPTAQADVNLGTITVTEGSFSNGNGAVDPGEIGKLVVQLTNPSQVAANTVSATVTTSTSGITITSGSASYGSIGAGSNASNTGTPFLFAVNSTVPCGTTITFTITVTFNGANSPEVFQFNVSVGNQPGGSISSTLGNAPPTLPGVTSTSGQQTGRVARTFTASSCASPKANPGLTAITGSRQFDAYTFTNSSSISQCVNVVLSSSNGANLLVLAYTAAGFVPSNPGTNYLADSGGFTNIQSFSFTAPAGQAFTIVVHDINVTPASQSPYTLSVSLNLCSAGPACTPINITTSSIATGSLNTPYSQSFAATGGSGAYNFLVTGAPNGLAFSGNVLTGTPTQSGSFPITVKANDDTGCPAGSKGFTLVINNIVFGDVTGDNQVTVSDLVVLANIIAGNITPTAAQKAAGDVFQDGTGQITIQDLVTLANFIAGNIHSLPVVSGPIMNPGGPVPNHRLELTSDRFLFESVAHSRSLLFGLTEQAEERSLFH